MDAAMLSVVEWFRYGFITGLAFVVLVLVTRSRGGE